MNEAQKFLLNNECDDLRLKDAQKVEDWIYVSDMMERYHKEQVKKLTIPVVSVNEERVAVCGWCKGEGWIDYDMTTEPCKACGGKQTER